LVITAKFFASCAKGYPALMKKHGLGIASVALSTILGLVFIPGETPDNDTCEPMAAVEAVDIALDFVPGVNTVKDLLCLGLGVNPVTGERVNEAEAAMLVGWLMVPWAARRAHQAAGPRPARFMRRMKAALVRAPGLRLLARRRASS
jgi:hypothetical protein